MKGRSKVCGYLGEEECSRQQQAQRPEAGAVVRKLQGQCSEAQKAGNRMMGNEDLIQVIRSCIAESY